MKQKSEHWNKKQVNFRIYGSRTRATQPLQRISRAGEKEHSGEKPQKIEEKLEKIAGQSSPAEEAIAREVADAKEGDQEGGEEAGDEEAAAVVGEKLAKSPPEQIRPLPFVDETAQEEE